LTEAFDELGIDTIDAILLTHIHLDHAGAIGQIAARFPGIPIVCHPLGIPHLIDPSRLNAVTLKVLGTVGKAYGPILPVQKDRLVSSDDYSCSGWSVIKTPGHAAHHVSYLFNQYLFVGEACGVAYHHLGASTYMRPATPPPFQIENAAKSIDRLIETGPENLCYGHFGAIDHAGMWMKTHRDQLFFWEEIIRKETDGGPDIVKRCTEKLLGSDPLLNGFWCFKGEVQDRERFFMQNSIKGFLSYLEG
jgi:glyoxylase-like metal-dependent hydrolase (beta-lactamase superfamily II)